jgi:ElaB/YqjD/DUF883 family membrane-anchored ribosome-binding protein
MVSQTDIETLAGEMSNLRSQIATLAETLGETAAHARRDAASMGRRAWSAVQDETDPYIRQIEDHPLTSAAIVFGAAGLFLGLFFARRL